MVQTGRKDGDGVVYPNVGAVVSLFKGYDAGYKGLIPPYVVLTQPQGRFSEAGFLGSKFKPFATGGDPSGRVLLSKVWWQRESRMNASSGAVICWAT